MEIPDQFLQDGRPLMAYVVVVDGESVNTVGEITFPVNNRGQRTDIQPTPAEQQQIDTLVNKLNEAVSLLQNVGLAVDDEGILYVKTRSDD